MALCGSLAVSMPSRDGLIFGADTKINVLTGYKLAGSDVTYKLKAYPSHDVVVLMTGDVRNYREIGQENSLIVLKADKNLWDEVDHVLSEPSSDGLYQIALSIGQRVQSSARLHNTRPEHSDIVQRTGVSIVVCQWTALQFQPEGYFVGCPADLRFDCNLPKKIDLSKPHVIGHRKFLESIENLPCADQIDRRLKPFVKSCSEEPLRKFSLKKSISSVAKLIIDTSTTTNSVGDSLDIVVMTRGKVTQLHTNKKATGLLP